jgi:hypothetical protein
MTAQNRAKRLRDEGVSVERDKNGRADKGRCVAERPSRAQRLWLENHDRLWDKLAMIVQEVCEFSAQMMGGKDEATKALSTQVLEQVKQKWPPAHG